MSDEERRGERVSSLCLRVMDWLVWNVEKCELPTAARIIIPLIVVCVHLYGSRPRHRRTAAAGLLGECPTGLRFQRGYWP